MPVLVHLRILLLHISASGDESQNDETVQTDETDETPQLPTLSQSTQSDSESEEEEPLPKKPKPDVVMVDRTSPEKTSAMKLSFGTF